jgi:hypothetical protein
MARLSNGGNGYQMKSTAIFLGVNVAASIPLVLCPQANAQGETQLSGTADFLKASLATASDKATAKAMNAGQPSFSARASVKIKRDLTATQIMSSPQAIATRQAIAPVGGVKLRPFMPGRKLPSKADMDSNFTAMAPQMDNSGNPLASSISENNYMAAPSSEYSAPGYNNYRPTDVRSAQNINRARLKEAARVASGYDRRSASRVIPGQSPATPGQVGFPCAQQAVASMQPVRTGEPRNAEEWAAQMQAQNGNAPQLPTQNPQVAEQAPSGGTAGPAPFPLNLLPEASLKQFIGSTAAGGRRGPAGGAAPSYFGSWKGGQGGQQMASAKPALQPSGFHTHLGGGNAGSVGHLHTQTASAFQSYAPMAMASRRGAPGHAANVEAPKQAAQPAAVQVASYGTYKSSANF